MATLPTKPPVFDKNDVPGTVKKLCDYTVQLQEQLDWRLTQIGKLMDEIRIALNIEK